MSPSAARESVQTPQIPLAAGNAAHVRAEQVVRHVRVPDWVLSMNAAMTSLGYSLRQWERSEHALQDRLVAQIAAARHQIKEMDLYEYLFATAATLREALQVSAHYLPLFNSDRQFRLESETERDATYSYSYPEAEGRDAKFALQFTMAVFCARAQAGTGRSVVPTRVTLTHLVPRSRATPGATFSIRASDLDLPMKAADPVLATILRHADSMLPPPLASWHHHFQRQLSEMIDQGTPSLEAIARRMLVSPRTLQRRLAEHGTTWRTELDAARQRRAAHADNASMTRLAHQLGYADPRSVRRAMRRWDGPQAAQSRQAELDAEARPNRAGS